MLLLAQRTSITWTKRSRGGRLAQLRTRVPTRAVVPEPRDPDGWLLHRVGYREGHGDAVPFGAPWSSIEHGEALPPAGLQLGSEGLRVLTTDEGLEVRNTMGRTWLPARPGHPDRPERVDAVVLRVAPGTWAGWVENQRHTSYDTGQWWYSEDHWCFAWLSRHDPEIFNSRAPAQWIDHRAQLR